MDMNYGFVVGICVQQSSSPEMYVLLTLFEHRKIHEFLLGSLVSFMELSSMYICLLVVVVW